MNISRRRAIQLASFTAFATAAGRAFADDGSKDTVFSDQNLALYENISAATFEPWVDTPFNLSGPNGASSRLVLRAVSDLSTLDPPAESAGTKGNGTSSPTKVAGFMLKFIGTGKALPQNTYVLTNSGLGSFAAFLVPSDGPGQPKYTAVFAYAPPGT